MNTHQLLPIRKLIQLVRQSRDKLLLRPSELRRPFVDLLRSHGDGGSSIGDHGEVGAFDVGFAV